MRTVIPDHLELNDRSAPFNHLKFRGSRIRKVQDTPMSVGASVVDPDSYMLPVDQIDYSDHASQGNGAVSGSHRLHIEYFAVSRCLPVKRLAVPGSYASIFNADIETYLTLGQARACAQEHRSR